MNRQVRLGLLFAAKLAFSALLLWLVIAKLDIHEITARLRTVNLYWIIPVLLLGPLLVALSARRWQVLSLGLIHFGRAYRYTWIGIFFGSIVPGAIGGDVAKGISLAIKQSQTRDTRLPVSIIADKLIGFWVLLLLFNVAVVAMLFLQPHLLAGMRGVLWATGAATAAGLFGVAALFRPSGAAWFVVFARQLPGAALKNRASQAIATIDSYRGRGAVLTQAVFLSLLMHGLNTLALWLVMRSLAIPAKLSFVAVFYPLLSVLLALPVSISGVGVRDVFSAAMFSAFGMSPSSGVAFSWLLLGLNLPNMLVGATIQLWEIFHKHDEISPSGVTQP